ncbi:MAG: TonB-dependent receptor plug domain-containing protein [Bacteroidota bacterium]
MSLNKNNLTLYFLVFFNIGALISQNSNTKKKDTTEIQKLDEVVLTGQINPQSVDKSVFEVKVIGRREIEQRAGVNLADLLNQTLNLNVIPDVGNGRSGLSLFGLDGQYLKVLVDNVPLINEGGFGNGADLSLINLDDVERVEIVEGAMGVQYGNNAVSGVINIITKKSSRYETEVSVYLQEETVGSEFEFFDRGRHIQSVSANHNFSDKFFTRIGFLRNEFAGFFDERLGENHDIDDGLRGHEWLPKTQLNPNLLVKFTESENFSIHYRLDYFQDLIRRNNRRVNENINPSTDTRNPLAQDNELIANRLTHNINAIGKIDQLDYNLSVSYQSQRNDIENYTYVIRENERRNIQREEYLSRDAFFTRATLTNLFRTDKFNIQTGYEMIFEEGIGNGQAILIDSDTERVEGQLYNYDPFISMEYDFSERFSIKPGARAAFTNLFGPQFVLSLSSRFLLGENKNYELRTVVGSANKTPTYDELFTFFVDSNHDVQGNPNLNPEIGYSIFAHLKRKFNFNDNFNFSSKISASYINLDDKIELIISNPAPLAFRFTNIDEYQSLSFFIENELRYKRLTSGFGVSVVGISQILNAEQDANDDFLFNLNANLNLNYSIPKWDSNVTLYLKHTGQIQQFVQRNNDEGELTFERGTQDAFTFLDFNIQKSFLNRQLVATLGARNLLNITTVNTTAIAGGAHSDAPTAQPLAYGRSFLLRLNYNFNQ